MQDNQRDIITVINYYTSFEKSALDAGVVVNKLNIKRTLRIN